MRGRNLLALVVGVAFATSAVVVPGPVAVAIDGRTVRVERGTTLAEVIRAFGLHASPGPLVDVEGIEIRAAANAGKITLDGRVRDGSTELSDGAAIRVVDGPRTVEPRTQTTRRVTGREVADPQAHLVSRPGVETITTGELSKKVESVTFTPSGPARPDRAVALTFDDGPSRMTPKILKILKRYRVRATFFAVGEQVERYPEHIQAAVRAGMVIANHSYDHPISPPFALRGGEIREQMELCQQAIAAVAPTPQLFRPPGGSISSDVVRTANELGMRVVLWSVDPFDWRRGRDADAIASSVLSEAGPGSIIVMHDGGGNAEETVAALPRIIKGITKKKLRFVVLDG